MTRSFDIVVAADLNRGIGKGGELPWHLPGDMAYFRRITSEVKDSAKQNAVIMGRKTWLSIPEKFRPLKGRLNIVLTSDRNLAVPEGVLLASTLDEALKLSDRPNVENAFVIGGGAVYKEAIEHRECHTVYLTKVLSTFACDTFLPNLPAAYEHMEKLDSERQKDGDVSYVFTVYKRNSKASSDSSRTAATNA